MNDFEPKLYMQYKIDPSFRISEIFPNELNSSEFRVKLYPQDQKLLIFKSKVIWLSGEMLVRQINVEGVIVDTLFTTFDLQKLEGFNESHNGESVLVIILEDQMRVYDRKRSTTVVSFPIFIKAVFPYHRGIILGKKSDSLHLSASSALMSKLTNSSMADNKLPSATSLGSIYESTSCLPLTSQQSSHNDGIFLTLSDPIGEYGCVVSSSTTSFSPNEELILFPDSLNLTLSATYSSVEEKVTIYYTRYIYRSKNTKVKSNSCNFPPSRRTSKRSMSTSSATLGSTNSKLIEDEHRTARTTSNPMSFDRMASGSEYYTESANPNKLSSFCTQESWNLRKDVIFSKIYTIPFTSADHPKVFTLAYKDREALIVVDRLRETINVFLFEKSTNQVSLSKYKSDMILKGIDASRLDMGKLESFYVVVLKRDDTLVLFNPFYELSSPEIMLQGLKSKIRKIEDTNNFEVLLRLNDDSLTSVHLNKKPMDHLASKAMESLRYLSHDLIYENFWLHWFSLQTLDLPFVDDWKLYIVTLLALCIPEKTDLSLVDTSLNEVTALIPFVQSARNFYESSLSPSAGLSLESLLPKIVLSLHLLREDLRLSVLAKSEYKKLSILLSQLVHWLSWSEAWLSYYDVEASIIDHSLDLNSTEYVSQPPNIMESLSSLFSIELIPYITFSIVAGEDESIDKLMTPRTYNILRLFEVVVSSEFEDLDLIKLMASSNIDAFDLENYPPGIFFILKNTIEHCQQNLKLSWNVSSEELKLIDRNDLLMLDSSKHIHPNSSLFKKSIAKPTTQIVSESFNNEYLSAWDGQAEADKFHVTRLLFSDDRRFYEVTKLLQTSKTQTVTYDCDNNISDYDKLLYQRSLCCRIAMRTLTTPIGRGAVFNSSRKPLASEGFPIPKMNFNILIIPDNVNVSLESNTIPEYLIDWGYFHNGASSGLSVTKNTTEISGSWIAFNKPPVLNSQHAGFLLGLGLNGHLRNLEEWHIYNYLGPKHAHTSMGLLIGMSASLKGTMNVKMTKILTVHVVAFLPPGSTNLNVPLPVQTAGIIGIGLVYLSSQHRRMSEILLTQISSSVVINEKCLKNEGYNLAAGIALGYVNLGKGPQLILGNDNHLIDTLVSLSTSIRDVQTLRELDKSCSGATMAMMLIFLKTNDTEIAEKLKLPQTLQLLEYIRPDLLTLRCLACNLIMWDQIKPSREFVESQIPPCISSMVSIESIDHLESKILPYTNILSGAFLSVALCFASTGNEDAKSTLLYYFDYLLNIGSIEPSSYDSRTTVIGVRNSRDVAIIGLSLVMAGTGDLDVMRRLRYLQGLYDENTRYGNYMAINMALGFLFLGGGQQAFKVDDNFAIAALLTSLYPMFGLQNYEFHEDTETNTNKGVNEYHDLHLQALRHFWALSVEDRCLVVREIEGHTPVKVDIDVYLKNETIMRTPAPCLLPNLDLINKIAISYNNIYFPVEFDLARSSESTKDHFMKTLTLFVDRKVNYKRLKFDFQDRLLIEERMRDLNLKDQMSGVCSLKDLDVFSFFGRFEKDILFESIDHEKKKLITRSTIFDFKQEIESIVNSLTIKNEEKVVNLKLIFNFVDTLIFAGHDDNNSEGKRKRRKKDETIQLNLLENEGLCESSENDSSVGLYYLNVEFIEKMKKELFSKLI
ncbi:hypothetical protein CANINC_001710 [Pichia inconspicua]|uniref:Uncharacterized protein n=1 Tax=Pichia inconspicua TaxID=52247 RepID=A0A4T0X2Z7_9ASCO|nr:hypothetical protein CANINC_001710 [[Candida] inconspicua]